MPAQWQTWPYALPRTVPKACPPIRNDKALHMEGFFASCGPPPARNELRGESSTRAHPSHRTCLTETGARHAAPRPGISLPGKAAPSRSIPARVSDQAYSPRRSGPTMRQQPPGSPTSPSGIAARYLQTRLHFPTSAQDVPLHEERPTLRRACSHSQGAPRRIRLFIAGRPRPILPEVFQRPGSKREREKTPASSLPSFPPPSFSRPHDQTCPFLPAASQRRGPAARPEESFFGDGESTRGEGAVFTKNAPSPLVIPLLHGLSPTKKAGQWPAPAFTGKTKER